MRGIFADSSNSAVTKVKWEGTESWHFSVVWISLCTKKVLYAPRKTQHIKSSQNPPLIKCWLHHTVIDDQLFVLLLKSRINVFDRVIKWCMKLSRKENLSLDLLIDRQTSRRFFLFLRSFLTNHWNIKNRYLILFNVFFLICLYILMVI